MKIYKKLHAAIEETMEKYNRYTTNDAQIGWAAYIDAAISSALDGNYMDWCKAGHLDYLDRSFKIVKEYQDKVMYHQLMSKVGHDKTISFDDVMCFVLKNYLIVFTAKMAELDTTWDADNVMIALHAAGKLTDNVRLDSKMLRMSCPDCGHPDFAIYYKSGHSNCFTGSCRHANGENGIWNILAMASKNFFAVVDMVYTAVVTDHAASMAILDSLEYTVSKRSHDHDGKDIDNANIQKIMAMCKPEFDYMFQYGFSRNDLEEFDCVGLKDGSVAERCNEANEYRHRLCWAIKDINGKVVGLQGRSVLSDAERELFVDNDDTLQRMCAGDKDKIKKNKTKSLNTFGFHKSNHLYLLYKYIGNASQYTRLVITEGIKDAMRVAQIHCPDVAVVSSFGCSLSNNQIELITKIFDKETIIELAYDGDTAGFKGNLDAAKSLSAAGFMNIRFVLYKSKNKSEYYKDFGDFIISFEPKRNEFIWRMLCGVRQEDYIKAAKERGFYEEQKPATIAKKKSELVVAEKEPEMSIEDKLKKSVLELILAKKAAKRAALV